VVWGCSGLLKIGSNRSSARDALARALLSQLE